MQNQLDPLVSYSRTLHNEILSKLEGDLDRIVFHDERERLELLLSDLETLLARSTDEALGDDLDREIDRTHAVLGLLEETRERLCKEARGEVVPPSEYGPDAAQSAPILTEGDAAFAIREFDFDLFSLRRIEVSKALSEETECYSADIVVRVQTGEYARVGRAGNHGHGGPDFVDVDPDYRADFERWVRSHPFARIARADYVSQIGADAPKDGDSYYTETLLAHLRDEVSVARRVGRGTLLATSLHYPADAIVEIRAGRKLAKVGDPKAHDYVDRQAHLVARANRDGSFVPFPYAAALASIEVAS